MRGFKGLSFLRSHFRVRFRRDAFDRRGYLAGSDLRRESELNAALADPEVKAVLALRGGVGASRFVGRANFELLRSQPKWLVGFSDITALHLESTRLSVASLHAPHVASLGRSDSRAERELLSVLRAPTARRDYALQVLATGAASGRLWGGNLAIVHDAAAAGRLVPPAQGILFLEDVGERPYRIDRMLTALIVGGHLSSVRGIVLGDFTDCRPGPDGITVEQVLEERLSQLGVPVATGMPAGHDTVNTPMVLGAPCKLEVAANQASLSLFPDSD